MLERRAAREVEELGLVVFAFMDRNRQVKADRAHWRIPDYTRSYRGARRIRIPDLGAAQLGDGQRPRNRVRRRTIGIAEETREVSRPRISNQIAGVDEKGALQADFLRQAEDREVNLSRGAIIGRAA